MFFTALEHTKLCHNFRSVNLSMVFPQGSKVRPSETQHDLIGLITQPIKLLDSLHKCNSRTHHSQGCPKPPGSRIEMVGWGQCMVQCVRKKLVSY